MIRLLVKFHLLFLDDLLVSNVPRLAGNPTLSRLLNRYFVAPLRVRLAKRLACTLLATSLAVYTCIFSVSFASSTEAIDFMQRTALMIASEHALAELFRLDALALLFALYVSLCAFEFFLPSYPAADLLPHYLSGKRREGNPAEIWLYNFFRFVPLDTTKANERKEIVCKYIDESRETGFVSDGTNLCRDHRNLNHSLVLSPKSTEAAQVKYAYDPEVGFAVAGRGSLLEYMFALGYLVVAYVVCVLITIQIST